MTVTFSAKSGTFSPASGVSMTTSSGISGIVSTTTPFLRLLARSLYGDPCRRRERVFPETAESGPATKLVDFSGTASPRKRDQFCPNNWRSRSRTPPATSWRALPVTFNDKSGLGTLSSTSVTSNASGLAVVSYQLPNTAGAYKITASAVLGNPPKTMSATFAETSTGDAPASVSVVSGNNQTAAVNTALSQPLVVQVSDQAGNPIAGVSVVLRRPRGLLPDLRRLPTPADKRRSTTRRGLLPAWLPLRLPWTK